MTRPDIQAPGLTWRVRKSGWEARWQARTDLVERGFEPKSAHLWFGQVPTEIETAFIEDRCRQLQDEMLVWGKGGLPQMSVFDGTVGSLVRCYLTDEDSPYRKKRFQTRHYYDVLCKCLTRDIGDLVVDKISGRDMLHWHEKYVTAGKVSMGHAVVGMLRGVTTFGATLLESKECRELKVLLHDMRFPMAKARNERLTAEMAVAIRRAAHSLGFPSIALAQALQFELMLRQKDVIGEWVPMNEPGLSDVHYGNWKWLRGLRWEEIDENFILTHVTSKRQKEITVNLGLAQMVVEELEGSGRAAFPASGPVVISETSQVPWQTQAFRKAWRRCADAAGVPKAVRNMDSRAGAISEATDAGADLEHVRQAATHSDIGMTQRYSRNAIEKTAGVMEKRIAHRNKSGKEPA
jgi:hypothetical protein